MRSHEIAKNIQTWKTAYISCCLLLRGGSVDHGMQIESKFAGDSNKTLFFNGNGMDYTIKIAGEAGQGLQTTGAALAKIFSRLRYHVFTHQDYMSRIRGGHNFYQIRISEKPLSASRQSVHILVALNRESIDLHKSELHQQGVVLYDPDNSAKPPAGDSYLPTPFARIAKE